MTGSPPTIQISDALASEVDAETAAVSAMYNQFFDWLLTDGQKFERSEGLQQSTAENYVDRLDLIHRTILRELAPDHPVPISVAAADTYLKMLKDDLVTKKNGEAYSETSKRKKENALNAYMRWRAAEDELERIWDPDIEFSDDTPTQPYRFAYSELGQLFQTASSYRSLPEYSETPPETREQFNRRLAQRLGIPMVDLGPEDWQQADPSTKVNSLIRVGYDAGLTPIEIEHAVPDWYDPERQTFEIPQDVACKQRQKTTAALSDFSVDALEAWLDERQHRDAYADTSNLWLNQDGNPYSSGNLCYLIEQLCDEAGIPTEGREIRWYSLRYTMGTNVNEAGEFDEANDQLRHASKESTFPYALTPVPKRTSRLNDTHRIAQKAATDPDFDPFPEQTAADTASSNGDTGTGETSSSTDDVVTRTTSGDLHADADFDDTPSERIRIAREILDFSETDE